MPRVKRYSNKRNPRLPTEDDEHIAFCNYLTVRGFKFYHPPQEQYQTSWKQKARNKLMGAVPGFPDLCVVIPKNKVVFIEMKRTKRGVVSDEQKQWIDALNLANGTAVVSLGALDAIVYIESISRSKPEHQHIWYKTLLTNGLIENAPQKSKDALNKMLEEYSGFELKNDEIF